MATRKTLEPQWIRTNTKLSMYVAIAAQAFANACGRHLRAMSSSSSHRVIVPFLGVGNRLGGDLPALTVGVACCKP